MKSLDEYYGKCVKIVDTNGNTWYGVVDGYTSPEDADEDEGEEENIDVRTTEENPGPFNDPADYEFSVSQIKTIEEIKEVPNGKE